MLSYRLLVGGLTFRFCAFYTGVALAHLFIVPAEAADNHTCAVYSSRVEELVRTVTNDDDLAQSARDRAFIYCGVLDFPPDIELRKDVVPAGPSVAKVEQASDVAGETPTESDWVTRCRQQYRTFRSTDNTVLRYGNKKRVLCPLPK